MNIKNGDFYFFSGEFYSSALPVKCKFIKKLKAKNAIPGREVALIEVLSDVNTYPYKYLVIVPRDKSESLYHHPDNEPIFVFVLDGNSYLNIDEIDLEPSEPVIVDNGGGIASSYELANRWQVKAT